MHDDPSPRFPAPGAREQFPPDLTLDLSHLTIRVKLDIDAEVALVHLTHRLLARAEARTTTFDGIGFEDLEVIGAEASYDGRRIRLTLPQALAAGESAEVDLRYRVESPPTGLFFSHPTEQDPDLPRYAATDHETERARYWLATIDHPAARPTLDFELTADASFTALANGAETGVVDHGDGTRTTRYRLEQRCPAYLTCFCVGELVEWRGGEEGGVPIAAYGVAPLTEADLERSFAPTAGMLRYLTERLGRPYPFPKYYQFAIPSIGGAMENISLVSWDDRYVVREEIEPEIRLRFDSVNLHEMAHSWFGDDVVIRDFADAWLKEGWATYMQACWAEDELSREEADYELWVGRKLYLREAGDYKRPLITRRFSSSWEMFDMHLYPGGAWRLHMLREWLGDEPFWRGTRAYLSRFAGEVAETADFRRCLEEASGRSLSRFFEQWLERAGFPELEVEMEHEGDDLRFTVTQKQVPEPGAAGPKSKPDARPFELDLEVAFDGGQGERVERIAVRGRRSVARFTVAGPPTIVRIDPRGVLLCSLDFDPGRALLEAQLSAPDVPTRIRGGLGLLRSGRPQDVSRVEAASRDESFYGVRIEWAEALGEAQNEAALSALLALSEHEEEARVLGAIVTALGQYRDARVSARLLELLDAGRLGPRAQGQAWLGLGKQRHDAPYHRVVAASKARSVGTHAQAGAIAALAETRRPEAAAELAARFVDADPRVRRDAAEALGKLARFLEGRPREAAIERLVDFLRAPAHLQRLGAAHGLLHAHAKAHYAKVRTYAETVPAQDRVYLEIELRKLGAEGSMKDAMARIDSLEEKLRALGARVDDVSLGKS